MTFHMFINIVHGIWLFLGWNLARKNFTSFMCGSNLLSYVPPSRLFTFFILQNTHYCKEWKNREGVCTTLNLTHTLLDSKFEALGTIVQFSKRFFNPGYNSTVKWNVIYTPHGISLLCILQNGKSEIIPRGVRTTTNLNHTLYDYPPTGFHFSHAYVFCIMEKVKESRGGYVWQQIWMTHYMIIASHCTCMELWSSG